MMIDAHRLQAFKLVTLAHQICSLLRRRPVVLTERERDTLEASVSYINDVLIAIKFMDDGCDEKAPLTHENVQNYGLTMVVAHEISMLWPGTLRELFEHAKDVLSCAHGKRSVREIKSEDITLFVDLFSALAMSLDGVK